jgi:hypothetical protein
MCHAADSLLPSLDYKVLCSASGDCWCLAVNSSEENSVLIHLLDHSLILFWLESGQEG